MAETWEDRIEKIARRLCAQAKINPDQAVVNIGTLEPAHGPMGDHYFMPERPGFPAWKMFRQAAIDALAAVED